MAAGTNFQQLVRELADRPAGTDSVSNALVPVAKRYQEIRSKLALANVRLVAHVSKRYQGRGVSPGDLIQEGICSLLSAIDRFEIVNETRLATYAIWWIRQGIQRAIAALAYPVRLNPRQLLRLAQLNPTRDTTPTRRDFSKRARFDLAAGTRCSRHSAARGHPPHIVARRTQPVWMALLPPSTSSDPESEDDLNRKPAIPTNQSASLDREP